jgi:hypothetical protein
LSSGFRRPRAPSSPDAIVLPEGTTATAYTQGTGWIAIVTSDDEILIYDPDGHALLRRIPDRDRLRPAAPASQTSDHPVASAEAQSSAPFARARAIISAAS